MQSIIFLAGALICRLESNVNIEQAPHPFDCHLQHMNQIATMEEDIQGDS
jgi:hypothetical protein